jgi:hypothetical protein
MSRITRDLETYLGLRERERFKRAPVPFAVASTADVPAGKHLRKSNRSILSQARALFIPPSRKS